MFGPEATLVELPSLKILQKLGYDYLKPEDNGTAREGLNLVILKDTLIDALVRINDIDTDTARSVYQELLSVSDNAQWTYLLRGNYSRVVPGSSKKKTIHLIDYRNTDNNTFTVTNQFKVKAQTTRIPDMVCFINGIPLVVIEAKSPATFSNKTGQAFEQIKQYEQEIPRLFYSNLLNIITDSQTLMYGATGSPSQYWGYWRDPWTKIDADFQSELSKGYYCLLEPSRLLDLLAHFVVFEKENNKVIKKICRYQQFRAVNKLVDRVLEERDNAGRKGLVWHTQGSGKSLTMVFSTLKLKTHLNISSGRLTSPNILILTDRVDLDEQISKTFVACGLPNPKSINSKGDLNKEIHAGTNGLTLLSTIFKFENSHKPVANSHNWILLVDECHRTQEKDLGAYLRKTFPDAWFFGFTGTPIKKTDKDTYANFSPPEESYLDKYSIDDAVADGATIPIFYTSRKVNWHVDATKLDILFDQWFANLEDKKREALKKKLTFGTLLKHQKRIDSIAFDIWEHFKTHVQKDGFKAQIVAYDREAIMLYKRALDKIITTELIKNGMAPETAKLTAETYSIPVYSSNQSDTYPSEDAYTESIRVDLRNFKLDEDNPKSDRTEKAVKKAFKVKNEAPWFLIVCSKLLTGFDAPVESVMYLDNPLKEHNLLQAIARTNRVEGPLKQYGLILDYVGVTNNLTEALNSYRSEDIENALHNLDDLRSELRQAHADIKKMMKDLKRKNQYTSKADYEPEFDVLINILGSEDQWLVFKRKAKKFIRLYSGLTPDPSVLDYKRDLKWVSLFLMVAIQHFEKKESVDLKDYSSKIREMLDRELSVTGIRDVIKVRSISDNAFWDDFKTKDKSEEEINRASVRKATELKKTISEKMKENPEQYGPFSKRLMEILNRLNKGLDAAADILHEMENLSKDLADEEKAHTKTGLTKTAHGIYKILDAYKEQKKPKGNPGKVAEKGTEYEAMLNVLQKISVEIDTLYNSEETAPNGWHLKEQMKKDLRGQVRRMVHKLEIENWKEIPQKVEEFALKHYVS